MKVCASVGCPTLVKRDACRGLCAECARKRDRERGTTTERGYGHEHQQARAWWQGRIDSGVVITCWRCHKRITGRRWHLDHDTDRTTYRGPACVECNLHLAGKASHGLPPD